MNPREFVDVDPRTLRLPMGRRDGADSGKLARQIARYGASTSGMPPLLVSRGADGELSINDGVTRATRVAKLMPGASVRVEVVDQTNAIYGRRPTVEDRLL